MNVLLILMILSILGGALWYLRRSKRQGKRCTGCPYAAACARRDCT